MTLAEFEHLCAEEAKGLWVAGRYGSACREMVPRLLSMLYQADSVMETAQTGLCSSPDYMKTPSNRYALGRIAEWYRALAALRGTA